MPTRRRFLGTLAVAAAGLFGYARWFEPGRVAVTHHVLGEPAAGSTPVRVIQLTDLHLQRIGRLEEAVAEAVHRLAPDVLVLTGDSIDRPDSLSGHTHGGQVNLAGWVPVRPRGSGRYVSGWYRDEAPALYVSRGIGTSVLPIRFGAPPEVAVFDWHLLAYRKFGLRRWEIIPCAPKPNLPTKSARDVQFEG